MLSKALRVTLKKYQVNPIIRTLIFSDFLFWGANNLITPIFSVFVVDHILGASLEAAGLAATLYLLTRSLAEIPVGMLIDKQKGESDDLIFLVTGGVLQGILYISFAYLQNVSQLYIAMIILGLASAIASPSWYSVFTKYIDKKEEGFEWSLYDVLVSIGMALTAAIGGYIAQKYGFDVVFWIVGILTILSGLVITPLRRYLPKE
jgi:MFS family permease